jgi:hypothetical protein
MPGPYDGIFVLDAAQGSVPYGGVVARAPGRGVSQGRCSHGGGSAAPRGGQVVLWRERLEALGEGHL